MAYIKNTWADGDVVTTRKLNALEKQYEEAVEYIDANLRKGVDLPLIVESAASAPTATAGRIYFNTTTSKLYFGNGVSFVEILGVI